jgi:pyruvate formate lyase activating enzyme
MLIGGYVPCSLNDFPGRIAAVVFTQGCNWCCPWCHNRALVDPALFTPSIPEDDILARLSTRRGKLDGVVISGGEPTLQAGLTDFIRRVRALGFQVKLDTNGSDPAIVRALIGEGLLDFVAMDIKAPWSRCGEAAGVGESGLSTDALKETVALLRESGIEHQLRTTRWPGLGPGDELEIEEIVVGSPHVWQEYRKPT